MLLPKSKNRLQPRGRPYTGHLPFAAPRGSDGSATNGAATMSQTDPADLTAALIRCPSVTPDEGGALVLLRASLKRRASPAPASTRAASPTSTPAGARSGTR